MSGECGFFFFLVSASKSCISKPFVLPWVIFPGQTRIPKRAASKTTETGISLPWFVEAEPLDGQIKGESMLGMSSLLFLLAYPHKKNKGRGQTWGNELKNNPIWL